jgi:hypothetical protein
MSKSFRSRWDRDRATAGFIQRCNDPRREDADPALCSDEISSGHVQVIRNSRRRNNEESGDEESRRVRWACPESVIRREMMKTIILKSPRTRMSIIADIGDEPRRQEEGR